MKKQHASHLGGWVTFGAFVIGLGMFLYPTISSLWAAHRDAALAVQFEQQVSDLEQQDSAKVEQLLKQAEDYNASHTHLALDDPYLSKADINQDYRSFLNAGDSDVLGTLDIPRLGQRLMIYYGTSAQALSKGIGHMEGSSLPIGGTSTHAVLAGHCGLPSARLFTDLDQMKTGDLFFLQVLDQNLAYRVDQIRVIEPEEIEAVDVVEGKDYVTLMTCTPYGVNTQRLLVRGERVPYTAQLAQEKEGQQQPYLSTADILKLSLGALALVLMVWLVISRRKAGKEIHT